LYKKQLTSTQIDNDLEKTTMYMVNKCKQIQNTCSLKKLYIINIESIAQCDVTQNAEKDCTGVNKWM
jgi:hypothetical protein